MLGTRLHLKFGTFLYWPEQLRNSLRSRMCLATAGSNTSYKQTAMRALLDHAVQEGVDWELEGIYRDGVRGWTGVGT